MAYRGNTYKVPFSRGGLTANPNIDEIGPEMMIDARNINIFNNGRGSRGGTAKINSSAGYGSSTAMGIYDYTLISGVQNIMVGTTAGAIWKDSTTSLKTGLSSGKYFAFSTYNDQLYICNGADIPQTWDGSAGSTSDMVAVPTDWTGSNYPKEILIHGSGNSVRGWAWGCPSNPYTVYVTPTAGGAAAVTDLDFTDANVLLFYLETGDGFGITGGYVFGDRIFFTGKDKTYMMLDTDTNIANWGYKEAQWKGGAAHNRLIVQTPNDIVCMMEDGNIYSVTGVQQYGDYKQASITKPSWIDKWIRENTDLSKISQFHAVYDPELRIIRFFVVRSGQTQVDTCLVYAIDRGPQEGWVVHDNTVNASGFDASVSSTVRRNPPSHHSTYIYTADYSGYVWELEESNKNDDGAAYYSGFKTSRNPLENSRTSKKFAKGWLVTTAKGNHSIFIKIWVDGVSLTQQSVNLSGTGALYGTAVYGTAVYGGDDMIDVSFEVGTVGKRIQYEIFNSGTDEDFFVSKLLQDFKSLGARPS